MLFYIFIAFTCVVTIQFFYYILVFGRFTFSKSKQTAAIQQVPISVIVCAKNEEENVRKLIPLLTQQDYHDFEIVLIDDASSDATLDVFEHFEKEYNNIRLVKVANNEAFWGNKKFALTLGIKAAKNPNLLFIDADCYPSTNQWIAEMSSHFNNEKSIVLGYGAYAKVKQSFLNKLIRFETLLTATQYFSWAKIGNPYMGVGRNLAYQKSEFFKVDGFIKHMKIRSGDDDLFINEVSTSGNTTICHSKNSFTYSVPKTTFKSWFTQKRRHVHTSRYYKPFDKIQLALFYCTQIAVIVLPVILLSFLYNWEIVLGLLAFRYVTSWLSLGFSAGKLMEKDVMYWFPILEIVLIFTQMRIMIVNTLSKPVNWK